MQISTMSSLSSCASRRSAGKLVYRPKTDGTDDNNNQNTNQSRNHRDPLVKSANQVSASPSARAPLPTDQISGDAWQFFSMEAPVRLPCDVPQKWSGLELWQ